MMTFDDFDNEEPGTDIRLSCPEHPVKCLVGYAKTKHFIKIYLIILQFYIVEFNGQFEVTWNGEF